MKKFFKTIAFLSFSALSAQTIVVNDKLLAQLTKNQVVRSTSEKSFWNSYEKQKKMYDKINQKIAQVVSIQEYIYNNLSEVNTAISQGKKIYYIYKDIEELGKYTKKMLAFSAKRPQYAILIQNFYNELYNEANKLKLEVTQEILKEDNDFLMDSYDRERLISNIAMRVTNLKNIAYYIASVLETANQTPYINQIPGISDYISADKLIINDIMMYYKFIKA